VNSLPFSQSVVIRLVALVVPSLSMPLVAGLLVDKWQSTSPVWTAVGVVVGSVASVVIVHRSLSRILDTYMIESDIETDEFDESATKVSEEEPA